MAKTIPKDVMKAAHAAFDESITEGPLAIARAIMADRSRSKPSLRTFILKPVSKKGTITQTQADVAVKKYLLHTKLR